MDQLFVRSRAFPGSREYGSAALATVAGMAIGVSIVLLASLILLIDREDGRGALAPSGGTTVTASIPAAAAPGPARARASVPLPARALGDVRSLAAGLFCRDLQAKGFSYVAAVAYWRHHGQPNRMDADRNGIPCETVYSRSDVRKYWSGRDLPDGSTPGGLFCRDLAARGFTYAEAVAYWYVTGLPVRMDADGNAVPCETV